jgi:hypothetical protein
MCLKHRFLRRGNSCRREAVKQRGLGGFPHERLLNPKGFPQGITPTFVVLCVSPDLEQKNTSTVGV